MVPPIVISDALTRLRRINQAIQDEELNIRLTESSLARSKRMLVFHRNEREEVAKFLREECEDAPLS